MLKPNIGMTKETLVTIAKTHASDAARHLEACADKESKITELSAQLTNAASKWGVKIKEANKLRKNNIKLRKELKALENRLVTKTALIDAQRDALNEKEDIIAHNTGHIEYLQNELTERENTIQALKNTHHTGIQGLKRKIELHQKAINYADLRAAAFLEVIQCLHEH